LKNSTPLVDKAVLYWDMGKDIPSYLEKMQKLIIFTLINGSIIMIKVEVDSKEKGMTQILKKKRFFTLHQQVHSLDEA
jgi:hypothetical protein